MSWRAGVAAVVAGLGSMLTSCGDGESPEAPNLPPVARIVSPGRDTTVIRPYAVDFLGTASDADGAVVSHHWDFGDGNTANEEDPGPYSYASAGTYTVTYEVTDDDGAASAATAVDIVVTEAAIAPEPGLWLGRTEFSRLQFTLNAQGTAITEFVLMLDTLPCTGGHPGTGRITSSNAAGWPVSDLRLTIETAFPELGLAMTVHGQFSSDSTASGTWEAVSAGMACSGAWDTDRSVPEISVTMNASFTQTVDLNGFHWLPGRAVRIEIDNRADGSVEFDSTARPDRDGVVRFNQGTPSFAVAEGDSIRMSDGRRVALPDAEGTWTADFTGVFDILASTRFVVQATCRYMRGGMGCGGFTSIFWGG